MTPRILAVDDGPTCLEMLAEQVREEGYEPVLAGSGGRGACFRFSLPHPTGGDGGSSS